MNRTGSKTATTQALPKELWLAPSVYTAIQATIGSYPAESGGILGAGTKTSQVTDFYFDSEALEQTESAYTPNHVDLTRVLKEEWHLKGIRLVGFVHSHPPQSACPSSADAEYAERILTHMRLPYLFLPIVKTSEDTGGFSLLPYLATRNEDGVGIERLSLRVGKAREPFVERVEEEVDLDLFLLFGILLGAGLSVAVGIATLEFVRVLEREYLRERRKRL